MKRHLTIELYEGDDAEREIIASGKMPFMERGIETSRESMGNLPMLITMLRDQDERRIILMGCRRTSTRSDYIWIAAHKTGSESSDALLKFMLNSYMDNIAATHATAGDQIKHHTIPTDDIPKKRT